MTTAERLNSITDRAKFETIANAILRVKYPELDDLIVSGLNAKGETIKDPLDAFVQIDKNSYGFIEHTTNDTNLETKWLNEKSTGRTPLGDLIKAVNIARKKKLTNPAFDFLIVLVTNQHISSELEEKVMQKAPEKFISVKIVELSILADFLDQHPIGQYFRMIYLGIDAELLSLQLLNQITTQNLLNYAAEIYINESSIVETTALIDLDGEIETISKSLGLLIAASGGGKSTAAYRALNNTVKSGYPALRIEAEIIALSTGILDAIEKQLLRDYSRLFIQKDSIRQFFSEKSLLVIDDINKQDNPAVLLEKVIFWMQAYEPGAGGLKILCPVWPKHLSLIENASAKEKFFQTLSLKKLSRKDGIDFIRMGLSGMNLTLSDPQTDSVLRDTQQDPLLLRLYIEHIKNQNKYIPNYGQQIIEEFVNERIAIQSSKDNILETKYISALRTLGYSMLENRSLNPTYSDVKNWFICNEQDLQLIESLAKERAIFYLDKKETIIFRHDRVRDFILILSLQKLITEPEQYSFIIKDPYYSELIGVAISMQLHTKETIDLLLSQNPLAVFYAVKFLQGNEKKEQFDMIKTQVQVWNSQLPKKQVTGALIKAISSTFLHFDTRDILEITKDLPNSLELFLARFRNGDAASGVQFFASNTWFPPSTSNYGRDIILDHVKLLHLESTIKMVQIFLANQQEEKARQNIYLLAGYLHSPVLTLSMQKHWNNNINANDFVYYFWGILNCFNKEQEAVITEALDYWTGLADTIDKYGKAAGLKNEILMEFRYCHWKLSDEQIDTLLPLIEDARYSKLIHVILGHFDSPAALKTVIAKLGKLRDAKGNESYDSINASEDRWDSERRTVKLSERSRDFLLECWRSQNKTAGERYIAFRFWCGNMESDKVIAAIQLIPETDTALYDSAIFWRAKLKDKTVTPQLISLIKRKWWGVRWSDTIWSGEFKPFFKESFQHAIDRKDGGYLESALEILRKINQKDAEEILVEFWDTVRLLHTGFITALFIATPQSKKLAAEEIGRLGLDNWENIKDYYQGPSRGYYIIPDEPWPLTTEQIRNATFMAEEFKYAYFNYGYFSDINNPELTLDRLKSLRPYFHLMEEHGLAELTEQCQRLNYIDWVKELYPFLSRETQQNFLPADEDIIRELKDISTGKRPSEVDQYVKDLSKRLVDNKRFAGCLKTLATSETSYNILVVICKCLELTGTRKELSIIEEHTVAEPEDQEKARKRKSDSIYKILRNTVQ